MTALLVVVLALASVAPARSALAAREPQAFTARLSIGPSGFEPRRVSVPLGTVRFVVTSTEGDHCFAIPALDVEKRVRPARALEVDVTFDRAGDFPFRCCVEPAGATETGVIVVTPAR